MISPCPPLARGSERRTSLRFSPNPAPRCRLLPTGLQELSAVVLDLSAGGAGLSVGPALPAGQPLTLRFGRLGLPPLDVPSQVVYCSVRHGANGAILGCRFLAPLGEDEVLAVLTPNV